MEKYRVPLAFVGIFIVAFRLFMIPFPEVFQKMGLTSYSLTVS